MKKHQQYPQVTLGGLTHALTPLAAANPLIHVVDSPALFLDALWLPFRRDHRELQAAVAQAGPVSAVFGHADVVSFMFYLQEHISMVFRVFSHAEAVIFMFARASASIESEMILRPCSIGELRGTSQKAVSRKTQQTPETQTTVNKVSRHSQVQQNDSSTSPAGPGYK